jgi:hypothetical protein
MKVSAIEDATSIVTIRSIPENFLTNTALLRAVFVLDEIGLQLWFFQLPRNPDCDRPTQKVFDFPDHS